MATTEQPAKTKTPRGKRPTPASRAPAPEPGPPMGKRRKGEEPPPPPDSEDALLVTFRSIVERRGRHGGTEVVTLGDLRAEVGEGYGATLPAKLGQLVEQKRLEQVPGRKAWRLARPAPATPAEASNEQTANLSAALKVIRAIEHDVGGGGEATTAEIAEVLGASVLTVAPIVGDLAGRGVLRVARTSQDRKTKWYVVAQDERARLLGAVGRLGGAAAEQLALDAVLEPAGVLPLARKLVAGGELLEEVGHASGPRFVLPPAPAAHGLTSAQVRTKPLFDDVTPAPGPSIDDEDCDILPVIPPPRPAPAAPEPAPSELRPPLREVLLRRTREMTAAGQIASWETLGRTLAAEGHRRANIDDTFIALAAAGVLRAYRTHRGSYTAVAEEQLSPELRSDAPHPAAHALRALAARAVGEIAAEKRSAGMAGEVTGDDVAGRLNLLVPFVDALLLETRVVGLIRSVRSTGEGRGQIHYYAPLEAAECPASAGAPATSGTSLDAMVEQLDAAGARLVLDPAKLGAIQAESQAELDALLGEKVLALLKASGEPLSVAQIVSETGRSQHVVREALKGLLEGKQVHHVKPKEPGELLYQAGSALPPVPADSTVTTWSTRKIRPSPFNHRTHFRDIEQLAESIRRKGQIAALVCRRIPGSPDELELVCGERRLRALGLLGAPEARVDIRELDDEAVVECQLEENGQRSDPHPLEEADGYGLLHKKFGRTVAQIAAKVSKSESYVYGRLALLKLSPDARAAYERGELSHAGAVAVARLSTPELQADALRFLTPALPGGTPVSGRALVRALEGRFTLRLAQAPFDRTAAFLVPEAGACTSCPKRTNAQAALFAEAEEPDQCTDPACFEKKSEAYWAGKVEAAAAQGAQVLDAKASKAVFPYGTSLSWQAPYVDLAAIVQEGDDPAEGEKAGERSPARSWRDLLAGAPKLPTTLARDQGGAWHELVSKADALAALERTKKLGELADHQVEDLKRAARQAEAAGAVEAGEGGVDAAEEKERVERQKALEQQKLRKATVTLGIATLVAAAEDARSSTSFWRALALGALRSAWNDTQSAVIARRKIERGERETNEEALARLIRDTQSDASLRGLVVELLVSREAGALTQDGLWTDTIKVTAEALGVDLKTVEREAKAQARKGQGKPTAKARDTKPAKGKAKAAAPKRKQRATTDA